VRFQRLQGEIVRRIAGPEDIDEGLAALVVLDPRLAAVVERAGELPLRLDEPGFASLVSIVVSQQVSRASADAIMGRLVGLVVPLDAAGILVGGADALRSAGLSRPKQKTVLALADAVARDEIDLDHMTRIGADEAMARLTSLHGIGPWTAEVYLLFCAGHPDIFPAHDVALQSAVGHGFGIEPRPSAKELYALAESWSPWRGVAARLFWAYYGKMRGRDALPTLGAT
jgi:DNA-3-methyladenine glycosylase II